MPKEFSPKVKLRAIEWYQTEGFNQPLTCSPYEHELVGAMSDTGQVYLECPDCGYTQDVPQAVYDVYLNYLAFGAVFS